MKEQTKTKKYNKIPSQIEIETSNQNNQLSSPIKSSNTQPNLFSSNLETNPVINNNKKTPSVILNNLKKNFVNYANIVYGIDESGNPMNIRDYYKAQCENDDTGNTVLVASIGTFGEGIDLCNIWSIFLVNSAKSERLVRQICGRGLRQYPGKDKTLLFDFVDDLRFTMDGRYEDNYMWKHYKERKKIYKEQNFPTYEQTISFS